MSTRLRRLVAAQEDRRRAPREDVDFVTTLIRGDGSTLTVRVVDLSPVGFHAKVLNPLDAGERVHIDLPIVGTIEAKTAWTLKGCFGCWFVRPIALGTFATMLAEIRAA